MDSAFYRGMMISPENHLELHMTTMRPNRLSPARISYRAPPRERVKQAVQSFLADCGSGIGIFSAEGLSYLRYSDEITSLRELFGDARIQIVVYLREKQSFLGSYRRFLRRSHYPLSDDPASFAYVEDDSWLVDYDALLGVYRAGFGSKQVKALSYESEVEKHGGIVRSFLSMLGLPSGQLAGIVEPRLRSSG